jgi:hypothetical protein
LDVFELGLGAGHIAVLFEGAGGAAGSGAGFTDGGAAEGFAAEEGAEDGLADVDDGGDFGAAGLGGSRSRVTWALAAAASSFW